MKIEMAMNCDDLWKTRF